MDELLKGLRHFIARDLVFVIGGGAVVAAFLYCFDRLPDPRDSWVLFGLLGGIGYFVGYALQDTFCLTPLVTTMYVNKPNWFVKWLYERFTRSKWPGTKGDLRAKRDQIADERLLVRLERITTLKQLGTAGGPCLVVSALLVFVRWRTRHETFDLALACVGATLGVVLICLGWLKGAQQAEFISRAIESKPESS